MRKIYKSLLFITPIIISSALLWESHLLLPVSAFFAYFAVIGKYYHQKYLQNKHRIILINKKRYTIGQIAIGILVSIAFIIWGLFDDDSSIAFLNIDEKVFMGGLFLLIVIFNTEKYQLEITNRSLIFDDLFYWNEWKFKKINKIVLNKYGIVCYKGTEKEEVLFDSEHKEIIPTIETYLLKRIHDKLIKE